MSWSFGSIRVLAVHNRIAHFPPDPNKDDHCHRSRNDQDSHRRPERSRGGGDNRHEDRPRNGTDLVKCLVDAEATAESDRSGGLR
jgi:hypothetical protein